MSIDRLERSCKNNRFGFSYVETKEEALELVKKMIHENDVVSVGGSVTLKECNILEYLENRKDIEYLDRYHCDDVHEVFRNAFKADVYLTSTNAITLNGELYNVDRTGNRVAAMIYGPKKVIVVVGKNKIVNNIEEAIKINEELCAIKNNIRLNIDNPCVKVGHCVHCNVPTKLCRSYTVINYSESERIHIILVNEDLGY